MKKQEIRILLNQITYSLPCQIFDIQYSFTKQERLPIVTEFVVRVIYVCGSISVPAIQEYFGFTIKETEVVIENLINERLVSFNTDNELEVTEYTKSKFADSSDNYPRFFKIEEQNETINFNLVSFKPLKRIDGKLNNRFSILLKAKDEHISKSKEYAVRSFERNFNSIQKEKDVNNQIELYKITGVFPKDHGSTTIPLDFYLKFDDDSIDIENSKHVEDLIKGDDDIYNTVIETLSDENNNFRNKYDRQSEILLEFIDTFKDHLLNSKLNNENELDLVNYIKEVHLQNIAGYGSETEALLGSSYLTDSGSYNKILKIFDKYEKHSKSICWLFPENKFFGRTPILKEFISRIKSSKYKIKNDLRILLPIEDGQQDYTYNGIETYGYTKPIMGGQLEILLYAPYFVCVLFHYHYPTTFSSISIPIGFISENPEKIETARKLIFNHLKSPKSSYKGSPKKGKQNTFEDDFIFLNLSDLTSKRTILKLHNKNIK